MPQPLSSLGNKISYSIGNNTDSPSTHRPQLALAAMNVLAEWSILESFLLGLFTQMLGENPRPAAAIYGALTSDTSKRAALRAVAKVALRNQQEKDVFEAILDLYKTCAKHRNKIAHWIWGWSKELPDAVLLMDPSEHMAKSVETGEWYAEYGKYWDTLTKAAMEGRVSSFVPGKGPRLEPPKPPEFSPDGIYIFKQKDFAEASRLIQKVIELVSKFRFVVMRNHPVNKDGWLFSTLSALPEIRTFLDHLDRRRTAQAAP